MGSTAVVPESKTNSLPQYSGGSGSRAPEAQINGSEAEPNYVHKMLVLVSAPLVQASSKNGSDTLEPVPALPVWEEVDGIVRACEEQQVNVAVDIEVKFATKTEIDRLNNYPGPLIIHFIGHGVRNDKTTALLLENEDGLAIEITIGELKQHLRRGSRPCRVAFINACYSQEFGEFFAVHSEVPHVIAISKDERVRDIAAQKFSQEFYPALLKGQTVVDAFLRGYISVRYDESLGTIEPENYEQSRNFRFLPPGSHDEVLNLHRSIGKVQSPKWEKTNLSNVSSEPFIGRNKALYKVIRALNDKKHRCILIHGFGGMGKTVLAEAVGRWQNERQRWKHGVWRIKLRGVSSVGLARDHIVNQIQDGSIEENILGLLNVDAEIGERFAKKLTSKNTLLILDDVDDLLNKDREGLVEMLTSLLGCRSLKIIVTSRQILPSRIFHNSYAISKLEEGSALNLFNLYSCSNEGNQDTLASIIEFLDGYPLAIKLAASYLKVRNCSLNYLLEELKNNPLNTLLDPSYGEQQNRDTCLRIALDLSYNVLSLDARSIFSCLALFPAGISRDAAHFLFGRESVTHLQELVNFSMAEYLEVSPTLQKFTLPEPVRPYAQDRQEEDELRELKFRTLEFYYQTVQENIDILNLGGTRYNEAWQILLHEQANLWAFIKWGYENESENERNICLSARITGLLIDYLMEVRLGELERALSNFERAQEIASQIQDLVAEAYIQKGMGDLLRKRERFKNVSDSFDKAQRLYVEAIEKLGVAAKNSNNDFEKANIYRARGEIFTTRDQRSEAIANYKEALNLYNKLLPQQNSASANSDNFIGNTIGEMLREVGHSANQSEIDSPNISRVRIAIQIIERNLQQLATSQDE